ncbi:hypothetical protein SEA_OTTAWA_63 [Arthrobacter phage Ottawa]|nr:hypothetical protein SEA_KHARCHO_63 [Arthrobacter phage Kharcho]WIC89295.1 hypothetical protein SEA_OTTAWA_63 [Arthrobacter phage Ottawa]
MCYMCPQAGATPSTPVTPARTRKRVRPGEHAISTLASRNYVRCNDTNHKVWFTATEVLCGGCGWPLDTAMADLQRGRLRGRLHSQIGRLNNHIADEYDESEDGLKAMASQLQATFPYLRLSRREHRRMLFRIATFQHQLDALDNHGTMTLASLMEAGGVLRTKIDNELEALMEVSFK